MANLDIECEFVVSIFNLETIEGYGGIVIKRVGDNMYFRRIILDANHCS